MLESFLTQGQCYVTSHQDFCNILTWSLCFHLMEMLPLFLTGVSRDSFTSQVASATSSPPSPLSGFPFHLMPFGSLFPYFRSPSLLMFCFSHTGCRHTTSSEPDVSWTLPLPETIISWGRESLSPHFTQICKYLLRPFPSFPFLPKQSL